MKNKFSGVLTALVTPFKNGEVDFLSFERLILKQLEEGVNGFIVNGTTGESPVLEIEEVKALFDMAKKLCREKVPVILGTGSHSTKKTIQMTQLAQEWGADGALVVTPYYNKPPQRGLLAHFLAVADETQIPIILYNVPGRTSISLDVETIVTLAKHPRIVGIKEATGNMKFFDEIKAGVKKDFILLSGDDASCVEFCNKGGHGVISVISHLMAKELVNLVEQARQGDSTAQKKYEKYSRLLGLTYIESNPIPVKAALFLQKVIRSSELRLPLVSLKEEYSVKFQEELQKLDLI